MENTPLVSIVTVCYNAVDTIEETILSVINQTYPNIEYIVIDGGSTDGTKKIVEKYQHKIRRWVSEADNGIYDAMNKGICFATGKWINFMNAGDTYYDEKTIEDFIMRVSPYTDIAYGDTIIKLAVGRFLQKAQDIDVLTNQMAFGHQAAFMKTSLHKNMPFETSYRSSGDYNFFYQAYMKNYVFEYIPIIVANYDGERGFSKDNHIIACWEDGVIQGRATSLVWRCNFKFKAIFYVFKKSIKRCLPSLVLNYLLKRNIKKNKLVKY